MSMHVEWDTASSCDVVLLAAFEAEDALLPDAEVSDPYVLVLGGGGGGCLAVEGTRADLQRLAARIAAAVG